MSKRKRRGPLRTLLLSSSMYPVRVISTERAIKMRYEEKVDVLAEYDEEIRSPSLTWRVPAVVREREEHKIKHAIRFSKPNVFLRDGHRCQYCGERFEAKDLTFDHVVPRRQGGKTDWTNIVAACKACNGRKGGRECDDCGMFPLRWPVRPKSLPTAPSRIRRETAPEQWLAYLPAA